MATVHRRQFIQLAGLSSAGAVVFSGCYIPERETKVESPTRIPEDLVTGRDNFYATACPGCGGGCGLIVRVMEGRAKKVEGNPDHPINRGKSCAMAQAAVQSLYHPDRLTGPMKLSGSRGSGSRSNLKWQDAIQEAVAKLRDARGGRLYLLTGKLTTSQALIADRFVNALGGSRLSLDPLEDTVYRAAVRQVFGTDALPDYDIANARTIVNFGADWLSTWGSPVRQELFYGDFRQVRPSSRGYLYHIGSHFSMSASNADEWIPCRPGTEGVVALSIANALPGAGQTYAAFAADRMAQTTGVKAEKIAEIARKLSSEGPGLVIGGGPAGAHTNGLFNLSQILSLNVLLGNVGRSGGVRIGANPVLQSQPNTSGNVFTDWERELIRLRGNAKDAVILVYGGNPVYSLPGALGLQSALSGAGTIISLSSQIDETSAMADLFLPAGSGLEEWGYDIPSASPGYPVVAFSQPVVNPVFDTLGFGDILIRLAQGIGGDVARSLPWASSKDVAREAAQTLFQRRDGSVTAADFELFWAGVLQRGGWWLQSGTATGSARAATPPSAAEAPRFAGDEKDFKYNLVVFEQNTVGAGEGASLPWLAQTPDPITTVTWGTWIEMNRNVARELGVKEGDIVTVESPNGRTEAPVYVNFGMPDWAVAMPAGYGRSTGVRWEQNAIANPLAILAPLTEAQSGGLAWAATRVRLTRTGRSVSLSKWEGYVTAVQTEHPVVEVTKG